MNHNIHAGHSFDNQLFNWHLAGMWLTFVISAIILASLIPNLLRERHRQQQEITALRERQLQNEQLIGIATLAAGTAHEMGTPLMTMNMLLDDIAASPGNTLEPEDLDLLQQQVDSCRQSLQQLASAGRNVHQVGHHDASAWLPQLLHRWRLSHPHALWDDQGMATSANIPASPLLDQAVLNLLDNAAEAGSQAIQLRTRVEIDHWQLDIVQPDQTASNGIRSGNQNNATGKRTLFNSQKESGMGLGLYLSNASVEQFGGSVHLSALANGASLCRLELPLQSAIANSNSKKTNSKDQS